MAKGGGAVSHGKSRRESIDLGTSHRLALALVRLCTLLFAFSAVFPLASSATDFALDTPHPTLSPEELQRLLSEMEHREDEGEQNAEEAQLLPHSDLSREEAIQLLNVAFQEQIEAAAGPFESFQVEHFLSNTAAVVQAPGPAPGMNLIESTVPLRAADDGGSLEPIDLSLERDPATLEPDNALIEVEIPEQLGEGITLPEAGVTIDLAGAPVERAPSIVSGTTSFYPNVAEDTDFTVAPTPSGVETFTQLRSPQSPTSQTFHLDIPAGAELRQTIHGGAEVVDGDGVLIAINPPTAVDAAGVSQPVSMDVSGNSLTLTVSLSNDAIFPILVDPTYIGDFYSWNTGSTSMAGWYPYRTSPSQIGNWFTEPGYLCNQWSGPWCGLYVGAASGAYYPGAQAGANYNVPRYEADFNDPAIHARPTSWIQEIYSNPWGFWSSGDRQSSPAVLFGLWNPDLGNWVGNTLLPPELSGVLDINAGANHGAKNAVFNLYAWTTTYLTAYRYTNLGSAWIYLGDEDVPGFGSIAGPAKWVDNQPAPFNVTVSDSGLGVRTLQVNAPNGGPVIGTTAVKNGSVNCLGTAANACPRTWRGAQDGNLVNYNPAGLPQGSNYLALTASDPIGNMSRTANFLVRVDHTAPSLTLSGTMTQQSTLGSSRPQYALHVDATDGTTNSPQSGVASISISVDGQQVDSTQPGCPTQNCSLSRDWILNSLSYAVGQHTVTVVATDSVGRSSTQRLTLNIQRDTTSPQLSVSGSLVSAPEGWVNQPSTYSAIGGATDPDYGVTQMTMKIDGIQVGSSTYSCPNGGCSATRLFSVNTAIYSGGAHTVTVTATDGARNTSQQSWTMNVNPDGEVSAGEATDTLRAVDTTSESMAIAPTSEVVAPEEIAAGNNPAFDQDGTQLTSTGTAVLSTMTTDSAEGFIIEAPDDLIQVEPTQVSGRATSASVSNDVAAVSANTSAAVDSVIRPLYDGVMTFESLRDASASETYSWDVQLDAGQTLQLIDEQNAEVFYADGTPAMMISAQPARDAPGAAVPTKLAVSQGSVLTLTVMHHSAAFIYPIVAGSSFQTGYETVRISVPTPPPPPPSGPSQAELQLLAQYPAIYTTVGAPVVIAQGSDKDADDASISRDRATIKLYWDIKQCLYDGLIGGCAIAEQHIKDYFFFNRKYAWYKQAQPHPSCPGSSHLGEIDLVRCDWAGANHQKYGGGYHITAQVFWNYNAGFTKPNYLTVMMYGSGGVYGVNTDCVCNPNVR